MMKITESRIRQIIREEILDSIESPEYAAKRSARQEVLKQFKDDREVVMQHRNPRGVGYTPGQKKKAYEHGELLQKIAEELVNVIEPEYDKIKSELDKAVEAGDKALVGSSLNLLKRFIRSKEIGKLSGLVQVKRLLLTVDKALRDELVRSFDKILIAAEDAETWLRQH